jgi:hypothetical protein
LALLLCGCATVGKPVDARDAPSAAVALPQACEKVLQRVPLPAVTPSDDARVAFLKDDAALITANGRIAAGRACVRDERQRYAAPH